MIVTAIGKDFSVVHIFITGNGMVTHVTMCAMGSRLFRIAVMIVCALGNGLCAIFGRGKKIAVVMYTIGNAVCRFRVRIFSE